MRATALLLGLAAAAALPLRPDEAAASRLPSSDGASAPGAADGRDEATLPTVTYIMPTNSRPEFVGHALGGIARQDYPAHLISEVVIVDDSPPHLAAPGLVEGEQEWRPPPDDGAPAPAPLRVVYVRTAPMSVGEKRNVAVGHARGAVILHTDDDDFYSPLRTRRQVRPIVNGDADLTVLEHQATFFLAEPRLYVARMPWKSFSSWGPHFGTLAYRRSLWGGGAGGGSGGGAGGGAGGAAGGAAGGGDDAPVPAGVVFTHNSEAEDYGFAQAAVRRGAKLLAVPPAAGRYDFVCSRHGSNTWKWGAEGYREEERVEWAAAEVRAGGPAAPPRVRPRLRPRRRSDLPPPRPPARR